MAHSYTECLRSEAAIRLRAILTFPSRARKLGGTETGAMTDLDPGLFRTRGRASAALTAVAVRALQVDDLVLLQGEKGSRAPPLKRLAERHHALARCLASGMSPGDAAVTCGYDQSRVSILQADPAFRELLTFYRDDVNRSYRDMHERLAGLSLDATALLQEQLEADLSAEPDERKLSAGQLMELTKLGADRTGFGPQTSSTNLNINVDMAARLEAARKRVAARIIDQSGNGDE